MKALVAENSKLYQQILNAVLQEMGVSVQFVETGKEALEVLDTEAAIDLICLSYRLPDVDGLQVARKLRKSSQLRLVPIVLLTSDRNPTLFKQAFASGLTEVLFKGTMEDLYASFRDFVKSLQRTIQGRVLYIEDSKSMAEFVLEILRTMQLRVKHFQSAELAFNDFKEDDYDLVITDIVVEGDMSGVGLVRGIRALADEKREVPILAVSSIEDVGQRVEILSLGANDYVSKPIIEQEFSVRVQNLIRTKQLVDQVRAQQAELRAMAITDQLTGLYNRHYLSETANKFVSNAARHKEDLSLLVVDLDHFKSINDGYGHDVGDHVLKEVGNLLSSMSRDGDVAARFGGEEFVLLFVKCHEENAKLKAESIRSKIEQLNPRGINVSASIGVSTLAHDGGLRFDDLFKQADRAVYHAKETGRNRVVVFREFSAKTIAEQSS